MSPRPFGPGEWLLDDAPGDPDPTPVTTIAWRLGHQHLDLAWSREWTFGGRRQPPERLVDLSPRPRWRWSGNLEFIHHMAEIAPLRDLYRTRSTGSTGVR
jgi:hypothetical protein